MTACLPEESRFAGLGMLSSSLVTAYSKMTEQPDLTWRELRVNPVWSRSVSI